MPVLFFSVASLFCHPCPPWERGTPNVLSCLKPVAVSARSVILAKRGTRALHFALNQHKSIFSGTDPRARSCECA